MLLGSSLVVTVRTASIVPGVVSWYLVTFIHYVIYFILEGQVFFEVLKCLNEIFPIFTFNPFSREQRRPTIVIIILVYHQSWFTRDVDSFYVFSQQFRPLFQITPYPAQYFLFFLINKRQQY